MCLIFRGLTVVCSRPAEVLAELLQHLWVQWQPKSQWLDVKGAIIPVHQQWTTPLLYQAMDPQTVLTRTTRTPAFWGYPPPPHDYPYHWVILDPKSKEDKVKVTNLQNSPNFWILKRALHATQLLKLLDKLCKYEMDPMSIVEDTERTRFCPQMDRRTDGQGDTSIPPFQLCWSGGYNYASLFPIHTEPPLV